MAMNSRLRLLPLLCFAFATAWPAARNGAAAAEADITFEQHVRPIFKVYCLDCHGGGDKLKGKLDLRLRRFAVHGGKNGPALVPGEPAKSRLLERIKAGEMPPSEKKVPAEQIAVIERWIAAGAPARRDEPAKLPPGIDITPQERAYWCFQPIRRAEPPKFAAADRVRTPIDAFVLAKPRAKGLSFNPDADKRTLLRRASLDLIGLPPTQAEMNQFLSDKSDNAYERVIDRLLASPHYGERWGRHWLDVAGYADSDGDGTKDTPRPYAWKYRDYVIRSLNADKPLDRFLVEQLAGDELVPRPWTEKMQADFNAKQQKYVRAAFDKELARFPEAERAQLRAAFDTPPDKRSPQQKKLVAVNPKLNVKPGVLYQYNKAAADELKKLQAKIQAKRAEKPVEDFVAVLSEVPGQIPTTHVFYRGDPRQPKAEVQPGDLTIAAPEGERLDISAKDGAWPTSGRRLAYARHLTSGRHPLLGRVLANRLWLHHFGRGIVETPGDFGILGQRPTHPELLDWLAAELPRQGWSLKRMHKLLMTSTVYRQSSRRDSAKDAIDSGNALYGRYAVRRLEAETLRDRMLVTAGRLDPTLFGPPVTAVADAVGQIIAPDDKPRRGIYLQMRRSQPVAFLTAFDGPGGELNCERRLSSTSAPQALMLMNSDFVLQQASHFSRRLLREIVSSGDESAVRDRRLELAWQFAYQRSIEPDERNAARRFLARQRALHPAPKDKSDPELAAWTNLCQQLLSSNEFLYVD
jgi:mono/diheme cytochrome c family protein